MSQGQAFSHSDQYIDRLLSSATLKRKSYLRDEFFDPILVPPCFSGAEAVSLTNSTSTPWISCSVPSYLNNQEIYETEPRPPAFFERDLHCSCRNIVCVLGNVAECLRR